MEERYERAVAKWLAQRTYDSEGRPRDPDKITNIELAPFRGGHCDTCAYESAGIMFRYNGRYEAYELSATEVSAGQFVQEVVELLEPAPN